MQPLISAMTSLRQALVAALKSLLRGKTLIQAFLAFWISPTALKSQKVKPTKDQPARTIEEFLKETQSLLVGPTEGDGLKALASKLKAQFRNRLLSDPDCMLPSYNYQLPNGYETGQYLALDVGGSTLRVALIELRSRAARGSETEIIRIKSFPIVPSIKNLEGMDFFNWMADLVIETVAEDVKQNSPDKPLPMGLAWSFPIE
jgi:hexokinase